MNSTDEKKTIVDYFDYAALATEFQRVFLKLENLGGNQKPKTFLITSATMEEGKSTVASFLAISMSQFGHGSSILIDADLRKPVVNKLFKVSSSPGLIDILQERIDLQAGIQSTILGNLKIITGGHPTPDADKILEVQRLKDLFDQLKSTFTFIVVDSAPVMMLPDALNLSQAVDGVILVVKAGATSREVAKRTCEILEDSGATMLGVILNNVKQVLPGYYGYKYYKYKYKYEKSKNLRTK